MGKYSDHAKYEKDGKEVPSVTTIMKIMNKPFIAQWANSLGWKRQSYKHVLDNRAFEGTVVHEICHEMLFKEGTLFDTSTPERYEFVKSYVNLFTKFMDDYGDRFEPIWGEKSFSTDKYGGTVDLLCKIDGKKTILDFKTSKKFYSSHFIQLGAYVQMLEEHGESIDQVAVLRLRDDKWDIKIKQRDEMVQYIELFNKLNDLFFMVYDLNTEWKDML